MVILKPEQKDAIVNWWRTEDKDARGFLHPGRLRAAAAIYHISSSRLSEIIHDYRLMHPDGSPPHHINRRTGGQVGRQLQLTPEKRLAMLAVAQEYIDDKIYCTDRLLQAGMRGRGHVHALSCIQKWKKRMGGKKYNTYIKPALSLDQKAQRITFINSQKEPDGQHFQDPRNKVHLDETWYYLHRDAQHELRFPGQVAGPPRRTQSKRYIVKVMCLAVVGYPHHRPDGSWFDGKIGLWPLTQVTPAVRNSRNRLVGAPVTSTVNMTAKRYVSYFTQADGIVAKIRERLHHLRYSGIQLQQDGARPHIGGGAVTLINAALQDNNWNAWMVNQSPQSPDLNVLDLGLFHGMKKNADTIKGTGQDIKTCVERMHLAYQQYPSDRLQHVYGVLYEVYRLTLASNGDNSYKLPHSGVRRRLRVNGCAVNRNLV